MRISLASAPAVSIALLSACQSQATLAAPITGASHVVMVLHPHEVVRVIQSAALRSEREAGMTINAPAGMVVRKSSHDARTAFDRLRQFVDAHGLRVFAHIEHDAAAAEVGMALPFTQVLVFGNPRAGTPIMQCTPTIALDLPLRVAVWEDSDGAAWVGYDDPLWVGMRHGTPCGSVDPFQVMHALLGAAADAATGTAR